MYIYIYMCVWYRYKALSRSYLALAIVGGFELRRSIAPIEHAFIII
jgi:hypothetical protein